MKNKRKNVKKSIGYILVITIFSGWIILLAPMWTIETITVEGNNYYTDEIIIEDLNITSGEHRLTLNVSRMKKKLASYPYIDDAKITFNGTNNLVIRIEESQPIGYVPFNGTYLCVDANGRVLTQTNDRIFELPIIEGLSFSSFRIKEVLPIENEDHFIVAYELIKELQKQEFIGQVQLIDVSDIRQIHLYVDKLDVIIGDIGDFDKKIMWLIEIYQDYTMGVLDLSMINSEKAILTPLT